MCLRALRGVEGDTKPDVHAVVRSGWGAALGSKRRVMSQALQRCQNVWQQDATITYCSRQCAANRLQDEALHLGLSVFPPEKL